MDLFKQAKDADIGSISRMLKHSMVFIDAKQYVERLNHDSVKVRAIAAYALGVLNKKKYLDCVIDVLRKDENELVRVSCIIGFRFFKKFNKLSEIEFALEDESELVKQAVIEFYTKNHYSAVKDKILSFIDSKNLITVLFVLDYISALELTEYKNLVYNLLGSDNPAIIQSAILTLLDIDAQEYRDEVVSRFINHENPMVKITAEWFDEGQKIKRDFSKF